MWGSRVQNSEHGLGSEVWGIGGAVLAQGGQGMELRIMESQVEGMKRVRYRECCLFFCLVFIVAMLPGK